jgi:hypothetical protein
METQGPRSSENTVCCQHLARPDRRLMVSSQTLHFRGSLSFFSLFSLLHCKGNGLSSVLRESSWEMLDQDPALSAQQVHLPAGLIAEGGSSVCLPNACSPHGLGLRRMGRPGRLKLHLAFPFSSLTLYPLPHPLLWG